MSRTYSRVAAILAIVFGILGVLVGMPLGPLIGPFGLIGRHTAWSLIIGAVVCALSIVNIYVGAKLRIRCENNLARRNYKFGQSRRNLITLIVINALMLSVFVVVFAILGLVLKDKEHVEGDFRDFDNDKDFVRYDVDGNVCWLPKRRPHDD